MALFARRTSPECVLKIALQRLSAFPDLSPASSFHVTPGNGSLDVFFSHANVPEGRFAWRGVADSPTAKLFVNPARNDWYCQGLPGLSDSLASTSQWIGRVASFLRTSKLRMFGSSMGAYAAIAVGGDLCADEVYALDPELVVGRRHYRSTRWSPTPCYPQEARHLLPRMNSLGRRLHLLQGAWDLLDSRWIAAALASGHEPTLLHSFHGTCAHLVDWATVFAGQSLASAIQPDALVRHDAIDCEEFRTLHKAYIASQHRNLDLAQRYLDEVDIDLLPGLDYFRSLLCLSRGDNIASAVLMEKWNTKAVRFPFRVFPPPAKDTMHEYFGVLT